MKIALDLDNAITASRETIEFFSILSNLLIAEHRVYIICCQEEGAEQDIACYLDYLRIDYNELVITAGDKAKFIKENGVTIFFSNKNDSFLELGEEVTVFDIR